MPSKIERIREVVSRRKPRGWKLVEKTASKHLDGLADGFTKTIYCRPILTPYALFRYLHEVGHIHCRHTTVPPDDETPDWQSEYEAEMWAIAAMRAEGFRVTGEMMENARYNVGIHIGVAEQRSDGATIDEDILKFAFPKSWRNHVA